MKIDKGYIVGKGNDFFGLNYESLLNEFLNSNENVLENEFSIIYSLDRVDNVKITKHDSLLNQNIKKEELLKKPNLVQIWFETQVETNKEIEIKLEKLSEYCHYKLINYYDNKLSFGKPFFQLSLYNKDCFIENHKDGYDSMDNRLCVIILYLNKDWENGMGGELIITDENGNKIIVEPKFGNFAIFDFTKANLEHEVKKIISETFNRKALISFMIK